MNSSRGQSRLTLVADFETTTLDEDCRVWAWGLCNIEAPEDVEIGLTLADFVNRVAQSNTTIYFHNLAFDGAFILDFLLRRGFRHVSGHLRRKGQFSTLISSSSKFYSITVKWKNGNTTEFRDSLKKLPMSVANISKAFGLAECKGDLDYRYPRPKGWIPTAAERDYIRRDVTIVAQAVKVQLDEGMTRLTVGADSLFEYKNILGGRAFERLFPVLAGTMDAEIRRAYRGGFTYVNPKFKNQLVGPGRVYDVNSLYPSVMYDRMLPYGEPLYVDGLPTQTDEYPLFIVSITFTAKLKPGHIPCIQIKGSSQFVAVEYLSEIDEPTELVCSNVDLELWQDHYDMEILSYNGGWKFRGLVGVFKDYIDKWSEVKAHSKGGLRVIAKLHLNSLYGKFATNPDVTPNIPVMKNNVVHLVRGEDETRNPVYTAMGVFITAYARDVTIRAAQQHYDTFIYADTDSLHLIDDTRYNLIPLRSRSPREIVAYDPPLIEVHPSKLGAWKLEYNFKRGIFVRAKCYTELTSKGYQTHIAGLPEKPAKTVTFADYVDKRKFSGKLLPRRVPGGIVLHDVMFTLNM